MHLGNLYHHIPAELPTEISECLMQSKGIKIERIVSRGHASDVDVWYDQPQHEWVLVVQGEAKLRFRDEFRDGFRDEFGDGNTVVHLTAGMYLNIPAHVQHRVEWTKENQETIWLAVFY